MSKVFTYAEDSGPTGSRVGRLTGQRGWLAVWLGQFSRAETHKTHHPGNLPRIGDRAVCFFSLFSIYRMFFFGVLLDPLWGLNMGF